MLLIDLPHVAFALPQTSAPTVTPQIIQGFTRLVISRNEAGAIRREADRAHWSVASWSLHSHPAVSAGTTKHQEETYQFVGTDVLGEIPLLDAASLVTRDEFSLVWMDHHVVDCQQ